MLVINWREKLHYWSVWIQGIASTAFGLYAALDSDTQKLILNALGIDSMAGVAAATFFLALVTQFLKQKNLEK